MAKDFSEKNLARKAFTRSTDPQKRAARRARRECEGTFGHDAKESYNFLVIGTTATAKVA